jgi:hypothetical protein
VRSQCDDYGKLGEMTRTKSAAGWLFPPPAALVGCRDIKISIK